MDLIKKIYENEYLKQEYEDELFAKRPDLIFDKIDTMEEFLDFLRYARFYNTDLSIREVQYSMIEIFNRLGVFETDAIYLGNIKINSSKYDIFKDGSCTFNYSQIDGEYDDDNKVTYYSSCELFDGSEPYAIYPSIKLSSGDTSLYFSVGNTPRLRKYDIKLNNNITLIREYSDTDVFFIFEGLSRRFMIRVNIPNDNESKGYCQLNNELMLVEYLRNLDENYDIVTAYNKLCEFLDLDVSYYPEIVLCESIKTKKGWKETNLLSIKYGEIEEVIRTVGDKTISFDENGNWRYIVADENVTLTINSGETLRYNIEANSDRVMDDYTDSLLKYDVSTARKEVVDTKRLVREKTGLSVKKRG